MDEGAGGWVGWVRCKERERASQFKLFSCALLACWRLPRPLVHSRLASVNPPGCGLSSEYNATSDMTTAAMGGGQKVAWVVERADRRCTQRRRRCDERRKNKQTGLGSDGDGPRGYGVFDASCL
uniref:Uncharacterized protein n=1 Tax=Vitrella brassicaformis TaxID=1169539 RepID=A0A7S1P4Y7_9ALVE